MAAITWIEIDPTDVEVGPPCPSQCNLGVLSHVWLFVWDANDGASLSTDECPICNRGIQQGMADWPTEYLAISTRVRLEAFTEVSGWESPEYDHYVEMTPVVDSQAVEQP